MSESHTFKPLLKIETHFFQNSTKDDESDSDLDLTKDLRPLEEYVNERQDLLEQMFLCVRGPSLDRALPDILKVSYCYTYFFSPSHMERQYSAVQDDLNCYELSANHTNVLPLIAQ